MNLCPNNAQGPICAFKQGRIADRTHEAQQFRASDLKLAIAAIVYWNSTYIADAVNHLRSIGKQVSDELLAHTSPLGWGHIAFSIDFLWDRAAAMPSGSAPDQSWANEPGSMTPTIFAGRSRLAQFSEHSMRRPQ